MSGQAIEFKGGMNLTGAPMSLQPGEVLFSQNFDIPPTGGYRRIPGYVLFDGQTIPQEVPGSGPVRGLVRFGAKLYAFRDNALATACVMHVESVAGWAIVTTPALLPGGVYRFTIGNFQGHSGGLKLFGCDGVNKGFQFDGTTFTQITTGMTADKPTHLVIHKGHLFFSFTGGSVQHSGLGTPLVWTPITGAAEMGVGEEVSGFQSEVGGYLAIFTRNATAFLTGTSAADWGLQQHSDDTGAIENSIQRIGATTFLDDRGIATLSAVQTYGNFARGTLSQKIAPLVESLVISGVACSGVSRKNNQYRIFFNNKSGLYLSFAGEKLVGSLPVVFPVQPTCYFSGEDESGAEVSFFGGADGKVYQLDQGSDFAGTPILAVLRLPYFHYKTPSQRKRFQRIRFEAQSAAGASIYLAPTFDYGSALVPTALPTMLELAGRGGYWSIDNWNEFSWSGQYAPDTPIHLMGVGKNMGLLLSSTGGESYTLFGAIVTFAMRGQER